MRRPFPLIFSLVCAALAVAFPGGRLHGQVFTHFEARHTHSIGLTPDGLKLLALNTPDARLSVFDISNPGNLEPVLVAEIPVGLEPVAVRARTNDEVWVVSEVGDSVAVVSLSQRVVIDTLRVPDEPADVVFAQGKAFVSCARNNLVRVFNAITRQELAPIPLGGLVPQALAVDAAGTKVYAAFLHSGNLTTILPGGPTGPAPAQPPPSNIALPVPPRTALIVAANDPRIDFIVLDRDVAEINPITQVVTRYLGGAGTNLFDVAVQPGTGDVWVANTEALNLIRFEPVLRGHFADHRLTRLEQVSGTPTVYDLNPGVDYLTLPNPAAQATALTQPTALAFAPSGTEVWVAAFGSDRIAKVATATGAVLGRVDLRSTGEDSRQMRGPRALALHAGLQRLYVLNKLANTISIIGTATGTLLMEVPAGSFNPTPAAIREGRGFLFDSRLSGNGTAACATCHLDADRDGLAWDLGNPGGDMVVVMGQNLSAHDPTPRARNIHPMKGPMVTQSLRGMPNGAPFHWRGDRPTLQSFNGTFANLMGGSQLSTADIDALAAYLLTLRNHPNPNLQPDGTLPASFAGGNPANGRDLFNFHLNHCAVCHEGPKGTNNNIDSRQEVGSTQPLKNPPLGTVYQRLFFTPQTGQTTITGFGLLHDGIGFQLPTVHPYVLDTLATAAEFADVMAYVLCFDTGTAPTVGDSRSITLFNAADAAASFARHEAQSIAGASDLVVRGMIAGQRRSFLFDPLSQRYLPDAAGEPSLTRAGLLALLGANDALTLLGTPPGEGGRFGGDRDGNGVPDYDEPKPALDITKSGEDVRLLWPAPSSGWLLESATTLDGVWQPVTQPRSSFSGSLLLEQPIGGDTVRFYHLRRTW